MLDNFSKKIQNKMSDLTRQTNITEDDLKVHLKEIRLILLEADVNYKVAKDFLKKVEIESNQESVLRGLNPGEQIVKIVRDEMLVLFGSEKQDLKLANKPSIFLMAGLQGSGKTTTTGKIANFLRKKKLIQKPLLIAADVYRPAAIEQLKVIGKQLAIDVYSEDSKDVLEIVKNGVKKGQADGNDLIIIDTAGRLHIDEVMLAEIAAVSREIAIDETFLVIDATIGQDSVKVATTFNETINLSGIIITKMDGDARGGAAMSVVSTTGVPIAFIGISEKMDGIELFDPERMVSRILGMGDMLGLIETVEDHIDEEYAKEMEEKFKKASFTLEDFLKQMKMVKKMGGFSKILGMMPGVPKVDMSQINDKDISKMQAVIESMTLTERQKPNILNGSRRERIAKGSGTKVQDVNKLIKGYENAKKMMKKFSNIDMNDQNQVNNLLKQIK